VKATIPSLLVLRHAPWEGPHRILEAFGSLAVRIVDPLEGDPLPGPSEVSGVLAMGGPMNVDETDRHPALAIERDWLVEVVRRDIPVLGICLGAQLLARALGAWVGPGERPEIGFAPVEVLDPTDPIVGSLAPAANVLHWHGDVFELPKGAQLLAFSAQTENQAFRLGNAWGLLFHPEADAALVEAWLSVPQMAAEAERALGRKGVAALPGEALAVQQELTRSSTPGFRAFAKMAEAAK
jgi:GMP synthase (glutamine-hydrolysing)